jgi:hypothetical protein
MKNYYLFTISVSFAISSHHLYALMLPNAKKLIKKAEYYRKRGDLVTACQFFELCPQELESYPQETINILYGNQQFTLHPNNQQQAEVLDTLIKKITSSKTTSHQLATLGEIGAATIFTDRVDARQEALALLSYVHDYTTLTQSSDELQAIAKIKQGALIQKIHSYIQLMHSDIRTFAQNCFMINGRSRNRLQESEYPSNSFPTIRIPFQSLILEARDLCEKAHNIPYGNPCDYRTISRMLSYLLRQAICNMNSQDRFLCACSSLVLGNWLINNKKTALPEYYSETAQEESLALMNTTPRKNFRKGCAYLWKGICITSRFATPALAPRCSTPRLKQLVILHIDLCELLNKASKEDTLHAENYTSLIEKTEYLINYFLERFPGYDLLSSRYAVAINTFKHLEKTNPSNTICDFLKNDGEFSASYSGSSTTHLTKKRKTPSTASTTSLQHHDKIHKDDPYPHLAAYILM